MAKRKRNLKPIPEFGTEAEERRFWETHDSTPYVDWSSAKLVRFPNLKPSTETISLRLPAGLLADLKALANRQDVPYQSLLKVFLADRVAREWLAVGPRGALSNKALRPMSRARRKAKPRGQARAARG
jgi:predicted DNA binding CopG/RHH family protein